MPLEWRQRKNVEGGDITISYRNQGDDVLPAGFLHIEFETKKGSKTLIFYQSSINRISLEKKSSLYQVRPETAGNLRTASSQCPAT